MRHWTCYELGGDDRRHTEHKLTKDDPVFGSKAKCPSRPECFEEIFGKNQGDTNDREDSWARGGEGNELADLRNPINGDIKLVSNTSNDSIPPLPEGH